VAISMIRSFSGSNPVISRSIQTSRLPLLITYDTYAVIFGCWCRCGVAFRKTLLRHILVTLGLRHPWLRTFPESNTTPALHAKLLAASKPETHSGDRGAGRGHLSGSSRSRGRPQRTAQGRHEPPPVRCTGPPPAPHP